MKDRRGQKLGAYTLISRLGEGGFAEVWLGRHTYLDKLAAIKILKNETQKEAFLREAKTIASLDHPHIVRVLEFNIEQGVAFLAMDYAEKGSLRKKHPKGVQLSLATIQAYTHQVSSALHYAHERHIIHRDIKPDNILMRDNGSVMLGDFGIAAIVDSLTPQHTFSTPGTQAYMPPEQMQGHPQPASDQYALAATIYEWITGKSPIEIYLNRTPDNKPPSLVARVPALPKAVEEVLFIALDKNPIQRFATIQAFTLALEQAIAAPSSARPRLPLSPEPRLPQPIAPVLPIQALELPASSSLNNPLSSLSPAPSMPPVLPPAQPIMLPTRRMVSAFDDAESPIGPQRTAQPVPAPIFPLPIDEMDVRVLEFESPVAGMGARTANAADDDDDLALPPVSPRQPQDNGNAPDAPAAGPGTPEARRSPTPLLLGQQINTPRPGGKEKWPPASSQAAQIRSGTGNIPVFAPGNVSPSPATSPGTNSPQATANAPVAASSNTSTAPETAQGQASFTPMPTHIFRRSRRSRGRFWLLAVWLLLLVLLVGGLIANAMGGLSGLTSLGRLTATVTITPRSQVVQNNYLLSGITTGTPDPAQRQVATRLLTEQSDTKQATGNATGAIPGKAAQGALTFINVGSTGLTIGTTVLTGADGVQVKFFGPVFVPATGSASATATGYAVNAGAAGNIPALDIKGNCCTANIFVKNAVPFTDGQDPQPNSVIQQSDIDNTAKALVSQLQTNTKAMLEQQVKSNERIVDGSFYCQQTTTADHHAGDRAKSVTVSASTKCTEEVFDFAAAQQIASNLLPNGTNLIGYKLAGSIITTLVSSSVVSTQGEVSMTIQAAGKWVYQFTSQMQQQIRSALVKHTKDQALLILKQYTGLALADINISSGSTMPANVSDITVNIASIPGLQLSTPGGSEITPTNNRTPTPTPTGSGMGGS